MGARTLANEGLDEFRWCNRPLGVGEILQRRALAGVGVSERDRLQAVISGGQRLRCLDERSGFGKRVRHLICRDAAEVSDQAITDASDGVAMLGCCCFKYEVAL